MHVGGVFQIRGDCDSIAGLPLQSFGDESQGVRGIADKGDFFGETADQVRKALAAEGSLPFPLREVATVVCQCLERR